MSPSPTARHIVYPPAATSFTDGTTWRVVLFNTSTIQDCINNSRRLNIVADEGEIVFNNDRKNFYTSTFCSLTFMTSPGHVYSVTLHTYPMWCQFLISVTDVRRRWKIADNCPDYKPQPDGYEVYSFFKVAKITLSFRSGGSISVDKIFSVRLSFVAKPRSARPRLHTMFLTPTRGYVQTPFFDGKTRYPRSLDDWVHVPVPPGFSVLLTVLHLLVGDTTFFYRAQVGTKHATVSHCVGDRVELYIGGNSIKHRAETLCGCRLPDTWKFSTNEMWMHYKSLYFAYQNAGTGLRMLFSFHNDVTQPVVQLADGTWNCSVPYWPDFRYHFPCNLIENCYNGEDEANCSYTTEDCGRGLITTATSCFIYRYDPRTMLTWRETKIRCELRGGKLPKPKTETLMNEILGLLKLRERFDPSSAAVPVGLTSSSHTLPSMYLRTLQWVDSTLALYIPADLSGKHGINHNLPWPLCALAVWFKTDMSLVGDVHTEKGIEFIQCEQPRTMGMLCQMRSRYEKTSTLHSNQSSRLSLQLNDRVHKNDPRYVTCPDRHFTHSFLACDSHSACWKSKVSTDQSAPGIQSRSTFPLVDMAAFCNAPMTPLPPSFTCASGVQHVPYTVVCDHRSDCSDFSDEDFCIFPPCHQLDETHCGTKQCVGREKLCDGVEDCMGGTDEQRCPLPTDTRKTDLYFPSPSALVNFNGAGLLTVTQLSSNHPSNITCPNTHFRCPGDDVICLPIYVMCNNVLDCPDGQDENGCDDYQCPGFFRCRHSIICLHPDHLCDDVFHCPQLDDELLCDVTCPRNCTCYGLAFICPGRGLVQHVTGLRYLDDSHSGLGLESVAGHTLLLYLNLSHCDLSSVSAVYLPNLLLLDLADNLLTSVHPEVFQALPQLRQLSVAGNPLKKFFWSSSNFSSFFSALRSLDLSRVYFTDLELVANFENLQFLNLSHTGIKSTLGRGFASVPTLRVLDIRGNPFRVVSGLFHGLDSLEEVYSNGYKTCCPQLLPRGFDVTNCHTPQEEVTSCEDLLIHEAYRVMLCLVSVVALLGNLASFFYRVLVDRVARKSGFGVFVIHLCASDFLMGVYLAGVGVADYMYRGSYLWKEESWRRSGSCLVVGVLSLLSCEVSALIICLITVDRFLALRFPFNNFHFHRLSAHLACLLVWVASIMLATAPLLPWKPRWQLYGHTGICMPLPITRHNSAVPGSLYSFSVLVVFNFVLFLITAVGQVFIYWSVRINSMNTTSASSPFSPNNKQHRDMAIARRLLNIALTDFLCWFPVGLLGLMTSRGVPVSGEVNVTLAILVLPLNSALNPFLYTVNTVLEKRRRFREEQMLKELKSFVLSKCEAD